MAPLHALAADGSSERGVSIYDARPQCTERRELKPGQADPCEIQNGPPHRRVTGARNATVPGAVTGMGVQGSASGSAAMSTSGAQARR